MKTLVTITPIGVLVIATILPLLVVLPSWYSVPGKPPPDLIQVMLGEGTPSAVQFKETELGSTTVTEATGSVKIEGTTAEEEDIKELLDQRNYSVHCMVVHCDQVPLYMAITNTHKLTVYCESEGSGLHLNRAHDSVCSTAGITAIIFSHQIRDGECGSDGDIALTVCHWRSSVDSYPVASYLGPSD